MADRRLVRIGGVAALTVAATQVVGNALHPPMPDAAAEAMQVIEHTGAWVPTHLVITFSYFLFVPFAIGALQAFEARSAALRIAVPLVLIGAAIGIAQILTHYTLFNGLAAAFFQSSDPAVRSSLEHVFAVFWSYNVALEVAHLLAIFVAVVLFGIAMLRESVFRRWIAMLGVAAGLVAITGVVMGKFVVVGQAGDLVFGFGLLPLIVWIIAVGAVLIRAPLEPAAAPVADERKPHLAPAGPRG